MTSKQDREGLINDAFLKDEITEEQYIQEIKLIDDDYLESEDSNGNSLSVDVSKTLKANKKLLEHPFYDYEPTDEQMMSAFGTKWHDGL